MMLSYRHARSTDVYFPPSTPHSSAPCLKQIILGLGRLADLEYPHLTRPSYESYSTRNITADTELRTIQPDPHSHRAVAIPSAPSVTMPRLPRPAFSNPPRPFVFRRTLPIGRLASSGATLPGRQPEEHAVNRKDEKDVQSQQSQQGMRDKQEGNEGAQAVSQKDERNSNQRAQEEHPESPMVIGMNDEKGSVRVEGSMQRRDLLTVKQKGH